MKLTEIINKIPSMFRGVVKEISQLVWENVHCTYSSVEIASTIVAASLQNKSIEYTGQYPNGDTVFERLKASLDVENIRDFVRRSRPSFRGYVKLVLAADEHDEMFYGNKDTKGVVGVKPKDGTSWAFSFLAVKIVIRDREFVVDILPLYDNKAAEHLIESLEELIRIYKINLILIDAGFRDTDLLGWIVKRGIHFITKMRTSKNLRAKDIECNEAYLYSSIYENGQYNSIPKKLYVYRFKDKKKKDYYLLSDMKDDPVWIKDTYRLRWGIETGFREVNRMEIKTTTKSAVIRLFFYVVSVMLYNLWVTIRSEVWIRLDTLRSFFIRILVGTAKVKDNTINIMGLG
jgi:IS4 transposase